MSAVTEPKCWRLWVDGEERTEDCDHVDITMPRLVYDVPHDLRWKRSVLGPGGFTVLLTNPSERLLALVDDGVAVHQLKVAYGAETVPVPAQFHMDWVERSGVRKMFGCLAVDRDSLPQWVTESDVHAGDRGEEGE